MTGCQKKIENIVKSASEGNGMFYTVRFEPPPSKTCFDVALKTYSLPSVEHVVTVTIPKSFPFTPPSIVSKTDKKIQFKFLKKPQWKPSMGIREVLIEACNVISRRDLATRRPVLPTLCPPPPPVKVSKGSKSPQKATE